MDDAQTVRVLRPLPLFADLPVDVLEATVARSLRRRHPRGQRLFEAGDPGDSLLVVLAGRLQVTVHSADGGELILALPGPGDVLGELGVVDGGVRSAAVSTLEASELLIVPRGVVLTLMDRHPGLSRCLLAGLAANVRRLTDVTADLVFLDLPRRLAKFLLDQPRDVTGAIDLGVNQSQLAARIGGTRQSVNSALHAFQRRGWLVVHGRGVHLQDVAALARFAGVPG